MNVSLAQLFQALADPHRVRMVALLLKAKTEICLCELSASLAEPEYKLSRHLKILRKAGIISAARDGKWIYHSLVDDDASLKSIYSAIRTSGQQDFDRDLERFHVRKSLRQDGRCRQPNPKMKMRMKIGRA